MSGTTTAARLQSSGVTLIYHQQLTTHIATHQDMSGTDMSLLHLTSTTLLYLTVP